MIGKLQEIFGIPELKRKVGEFLRQHHVVTIDGRTIVPELAQVNFLERSLRTLAVRVKQHNRNAEAVARYLEEQPGVEKVYYPGLESHPDHEIARRQMSGFGGVVSFEIEGDKDQTSRFIDRLRLPYIGPTLGGVESADWLGIQQVAEELHMSARRLRVFVAGPVEVDETAVLSLVERSAGEVRDGLDAGAVLLGSG